MSLVRLSWFLPLAARSCRTIAVIELSKNSHGSSRDGSRPFSRLYRDSMSVITRWCARAVTCSTRSGAAAAWRAGAGAGWFAGVRHEAPACAMNTGVRASCSEPSEDAFGEEEADVSRTPFHLVVTTILAQKT